MDCGAERISELVEIAKRIALLPRDAARVINGLLHLPVDTMRAIAVLDDPAEGGTPLKLRSPLTERSLRQ